MDLNSYIHLKEAYSQVGKPHQLTESSDSIWEEVEAFAHALVEEEGLDLSDMTWDEVREAYLREFEDTSWIKDKPEKPNETSQNRQRRQQGRAYGRTRSQQQMDAKIDKNFGNKKPVTGLSNLGKDYAAQEKAASAKAAASVPATKPATGGSGGGGNTGGSGGGGNTGGSGGGSRTAPVAKVAPKPAAQTGNKKADMASWAKANPKLAAAQKQRSATKGTSATSNPMMKDLAKRMPKPAAPKPAAPSFGAGIKAGSMLKKEESEFDIILTHLIEQGFGDDEALKLMVNMPEEKRVEILQLDELSKKTMGSYVKKAAKDVEKRSYSQGETDAEDAEIGLPGQTPKDKKIDKRQKGIGRAVGKMTQKEQDESLFQAYLSMVSEEGSDKRKDSDLEKGGHAARTDYSKPPATGNDFGKKKPMSDEERSAAMAKVVARLKKQGGK